MNPNKTLFWWAIKPVSRVSYFSATQAPVDRPIMLSTKLYENSANALFTWLRLSDLIRA